MLALSRRALIAFAVLAALPAAAADAPTDTLDLKTKYGDVVIKLLPDVAPKHVKQVQALVARQFYDGLKFHRVIPGFMAQTGDPKGDGTGGSDMPNVPLEASSTPFQARQRGHGAGAGPGFRQLAVLHLHRRRRLLDRQLHHIRPSG